MILDAFTPGQISAFWAGVTGITAVITGIVAVASLRAIKQDSRDRSRPVVAADLMPVVLSRGTGELVIQNLGSSVAKKVRVEFSPPLTEAMGVVTGYLARRYENPIATMVPGRRLTNIYCQWTGDGSTDLVESVPHELSVTISYEDAHGHKYSDMYDLSVMTLRNQTSSKPLNTDDNGMKRRVVQALEEVARGVSR